MEHRGHSRYGQNARINARDASQGATKMFTLENTSGFTESQLDELNRRLKVRLRQLGYYKLGEDDTDERYQIMHWASDDVSNEWTEQDTKTY
jgi:hypothetical protein